MAPWSKLWRRALFRLCIKLPLIYPALEMDLLEGASCHSPHVAENGYSPGTCQAGSFKRAIIVMKPKHCEKSSEDESNRKSKDAAMEATAIWKSSDDEPCGRDWYVNNGGSNKFSLHTEQGLKGINQDTMIVWEKFALQEDIVFCGVFDGHGKHGHRVARRVRDVLPHKLASSWQAHKRAENGNSSSEDSETDTVSRGGREGSFLGDMSGDPLLITAWKESFVMAYKLMDRELLIDDQVDCVSSGTTAVTLIKKGNDLIVGNVGDSRAILGTRTCDDSLLAVQLTIDSKPNTPREADRIRRNNGRVFALSNEPSVHRVWLPYCNTPGLAMARSLGDYCVKNYGVISEPEVTYRRLTKRDEFVVLATDGVWDVLTNEQVVEIVALIPDKSQAARMVVECAVHAWKSKYRKSKVDDCAAVCLFL